MPTKALTVKNETTSLQEMVDTEAQTRKILTQFITDHMVKGTDYGGIMMGGRMSKDSLFKPGAEKIASLLKLRADIERDQDTWEMAGSKPGLFCYKCRLFNTQDKEVGMGLGACDLSEKKTHNIAIKIAKKRAFVDAVLTTGALSDFFTQDLEDGGDGEEIVTRQINDDRTAPVQIESHYMITDKQTSFIRKLLSEKRYTERDLLHKYDITSLSQMTGEQASEAIAGLMKVKPKATLATSTEGYAEPEVDIDEAEQGILEMQMAENEDLRSEYSSK